MSSMIFSEDTEMIETILRYADDNLCEIVFLQEVLHDIKLDVWLSIYASLEQVIHRS